METAKMPQTSTDEGFKNMWSLYTMEFYSDTKKNEDLTFASKWVKLENSILSDIRQAQKAKHHILPLMKIVELK
jgi:hypothetical protein